jgi:hypothetical protein
MRRYHVTTVGLQSKSDVSESGMGVGACRVIEIARRFAVRGVRSRFASLRKW